MPNDPGPPPPPPPRSRAFPRRASARARQGPNALLAALPAATYAALAPHLERVSLASGDLVHDARAPMADVYFPDTAVLSLLARLENGTVIEVGNVGREGFSGLPVLFGTGSSPTRCIAQVPGDARRLPSAVLRDLLADGGPLRDVLLRYGHAFLFETSQTAACNALHSVVERCARWLLAADDTAGSVIGGGVDGGDDGSANGGSFLLKQEYLAYLLGVRREGVSAAERALRTAGLITFARGRIAVTDRSGLEAAACECYGTVTAEYARVLGASGRRRRGTGGGVESPTDRDLGDDAA